MFKSPTASYVFLAAASALTLLVLAAIVAPGCTGPASAQPCDYVSKFKEGAAQGRGYSRRAGIEVVDQGSSVYVQQFTDDPNVILHTPGVLIDKRSCRVCEVNGYSSIGHEPDRIVLASYPAERPQD